MDSVYSNGSSVPVFFLKEGRPLGFKGNEKLFKSLLLKLS